MAPAETLPRRSSLSVSSSSIPRRAAPAYSIQWVVALARFYTDVDVTGTDASTNDIQEPFPVARKRFAAQSDFLRELKNLKHLRASLSHHDRIARYIATVTVGLDESAQCNILLPLADSDLEKFLTGRPPHPSTPITLFDMLAEARNLAGALQFLHEHIQLDHGLVRPVAPFAVDGHVRCCHMDLKPANILVYLGEAARPVGKWKITDFGISVLSCPEDGPLQSREVTATMRTYATRPPGTYQPPELTEDGSSQALGRRSDIWSFACILVRILVRAMTGPAGLSEFDDLRGRTDCGTAEHRHDYFYRGSPPSLNPYVRSWIDGMATLDPSHNSAALDRCKDLLLAMFNVDRRNRPTSKQVHSGLGGILKLLMRRQPTPPLPLENDEGQLQPVVPASSPSSPGSTRASVRYLLQCIDEGDVENIPTQLSLVPNPNELFQGRSALLSAVRAAYPDPTTLRQLLHHARSLEINLDLEIKGKSGQTALVIAAEAGNVSTIEALLGAGAAIDGRREGSLTPLMTASFHGHILAVEVLLDRGADPLAVSQNGWNSLHHAAAGKGTAQVITCLCKVVSVNTVSSRGESPLLVAVRRTPDTNLGCEWREKFNALLAFEPDLNLSDSSGQTPLAVAVANRRWNWARALLEHKATWTGDIPRNMPNNNIRDLLRSRITRPRGASEGNIQPRRSSTSIFRTWTNPRQRDSS